MFTHPSEIPAMLSDSWTSTKDYYAGRDVADLPREELVELVSWGRKTAVKMTGQALLLGFMVIMAILSSRKAC